MDELSAAAREILSDMRREEAQGRGARDRVRRRLALSLGSTVSATALVGKSAAAIAAPSGGAAVGGAAAVSVTKLAFLVAVGALAGSAVLAPVALLTGPERAAVRPEGERKPALRAVARHERAVSRTAAPLTLPEPRAVPSAPPVNPSVTRSGPASAEPPRPRSLASETRLLADARDLMRMGRARDALALLDQHSRLYPNGALAEEAAASRIFSLAALGRVADADAERARFHVQFPRSPLGPRVDRALSP